MLDIIQKHPRSSAAAYDFAVLLPTWNNLHYFELCVRSILENSNLSIQIIAIVNEGKDGTAEWVATQPEIDYIHAKQNIGICYGLNAARTLVKAPYMVYVNDDMYLLPGWDLALKREIDSIGHNLFMLSSTMIEYHDSGNKAVVVADYGHDVESFRESELKADAPKLKRADWLGSTWPPNVIATDLWDLVGGMSIEYSPGFYSDPDLSRKLYAAGVRHFRGVGDSLAYHFGSKSTNRIARNPGRQTFLLKWGISSSVFTKEILRTGQTWKENALPEKLPESASIVERLKRMRAGWQKRT